MRAPPGCANFHSTSFLRKSDAKVFLCMGLSICFLYAFICRGPSQTCFLVRKTWQTRKVVYPSKHGWTNKNWCEWKNSPPVSFLCIFPKKKSHTFSSESQVWRGSAPLFRFSTQKGSAKPLFSEDTTPIAPEKSIFPQKFRNPDACIKVKCLNFPCVFFSMKNLYFSKTRKNCQPGLISSWFFSPTHQTFPLFRFFSASYAFDEPSYAFRTFHCICFHLRFFLKKSHRQCFPRLHTYHLKNAHRQ